MSNNLKKLIDLLQSDTKLIGQFMSDPKSVLENAGLSHDEKKAILSRDVNALNELGLTSSQAVGALSGAHSQRCRSGL